MTITGKEAARILDPKTSRDALWEYEEEDRLEACNEACRVAAAVLRAQPHKLDRNRWEKCPICKVKTCTTCRRFVHNYQGLAPNHPCRGCYKPLYSDYAPDNYCCCCGRPLTEKTWAELERRIGGPDETD